MCHAIGMPVNREIEENYVALWHANDVAFPAMSKPTTLKFVRDRLGKVGDLTAFALRYRIPLRTLMRIKSPTTTSARQSTIDKIAKAIEKSKATKP